MNEDFIRATAVNHARRSAASYRFFAAGGRRHTVCGAARRPSPSSPSDHPFGCWLYSSRVVWAYAVSSTGGALAMPRGDGDRAHGLTKLHTRRSARDVCPMCPAAATVAFCPPACVRAANCVAASFIFAHFAACFIHARGVWRKSRKGVAHYDGLIRNPCR